MKLQQFSKRKPCYYCGTLSPQGSTREHAPSQLMFRLFDCDSITVPSCRMHNNNKSNRDRGLVTALIRSLDQIQNNFSSGQKPTKVTEAINDLRRDFQQAANEVQMRPLINDGPEKFRIDLPYSQPSVDVKEWIRQLTAAVLWALVGYNEASSVWTDAKPWSAEWIGTDVPLEMQEAGERFIQNQRAKQFLESYHWIDGWSAQPRPYPDEIYNFSLCLLPRVDWADYRIAIRHVFYSEITWHILFTPCDATVAALGAQKNYRE